MTTPLDIIVGVWFLASVLTFAYGMLECFECQDTRSAPHCIYAPWLPGMIPLLGTQALGIICLGIYYIWPTRWTPQSPSPTPYPVVIPYPHPPRTPAPLRRTSPPTSPRINIISASSHNDLEHPRHVSLDLRLDSTAGPSRKTSFATTALHSDDDSFEEDLFDYMRKADYSASHGESISLYRTGLRF